MTQPETAVGGEATPASPTDAFETIAQEMLDGEQDAPEDKPEPEEAPQGEEADELDEDDAEDEAEQPPIAPPVSLTAEDKEIFKNLPREAQEFTARRIGELEKGFQTKAQEAAQAREAARSEALQFASQLKAEAVEHLQRYAQQLEVRPPDAALYRANPEIYAQQLENYQHAQAQREQAQHDASRLQSEQAQYQSELEQHEANQFRQRLASEIPEAFDPVSGQKFLEELAATAKALDYDESSISQASVEELKALKAVGVWKAKAERLDRLEAKKMERVRAGKNPPPVTKPGAPRGASQVKSQRAEDAFQRAKSSSGTARNDALAEYFQNAGII